MNITFRWTNNRLAGEIRSQESETYRCILTVSWTPVDEFVQHVEVQTRVIALNWNIFFQFGMWFDEHVADAPQGWILGMDKR